MLIYQTQDYNDMSRKAANIISAQIIMKPDAVLGLATGSSAIGIYENIIRDYKNERIDLSSVKTVNLDEYQGLAATDDQSYAYFMKINLYDHVNIKPENINIPNGLNMDADNECNRYNQIIKSLGSIDLQLLGIGVNAHIGFNEPNTHFAKDTHLVKLTDDTIHANSRFFENIEDVPRCAYTMGIRSIMESNQILLVASGSGKAEALYLSLYGPITPMVPASILQLHKNVTIVADEAALSIIREKGLLPSTSSEK